MRFNAKDFPGLVISGLAAAGFFYACMQLAGCATTHVTRRTAAGTATQDTTTVAGVYSNTEVTETSNREYEHCLETRRAQGLPYVVDDQYTCFGQTTMGQGIAGMYGMGSPQYNAYMNYWGSNFVPGWNPIPVATGSPNIMMVNGRPILIPVGANVNQGSAGPLAAQQTLAMEDLRQRAGLANQPQWAVATAPQSQPVVASVTAAPQQGFVVTQDMWRTMTRQVALNANRRRH